MPHSEAPWQASILRNFSGTHVIFIRDNHDKQLAQTRTCDRDSTEDETRANGSLLAASPKLLAACEAVVEFVANQDLSRNATQRRAEDVWLWERLDAVAAQCSKAVALATPEPQEGA